MNNNELRDLPLKTVGKEVLFIETDDTTVRVGEGAFLSLRDGSILHAYTEYCGGDIHDHGAANIAAIFSRDEGETWGEKRILVSRGDAINLMSVSLLRLQNGEILLFYLKKIKHGEKMLCYPCVRSSRDECQSFGEERFCADPSALCDYFIVNNDRVVQLKSGRILIPAAHVNRNTGKMPWGEEICYFASDDNGKSWNRLKVCHRMPFENVHGFEEPGLYQHEDGSLWSYYRTDIGCQFEASSLDDGNTWTTPKPNTFFTSARSPMLVKKVCKNFTAAVWNPISLYRGRNLGGIRGRAPFLLAISKTDGTGHNQEGFPLLCYIETDMDNDYCYPAILDRGDYLLLAYYHSNGRERPLNCLKIVKIFAKEIETKE
jgi:hypothetical protein